jgi:intraflagellar transport protein 81
VYDVLGQILPKLEMHKTRAYLARYLVKVHIPPEILQNDEVVAVHDKYTTLMAAFMETHKEVKELRSSQFSGDVIKKDISMMENELDTLTRRTERLRTKAQGFPKFQEMLQVARALRLQQERSDEIRTVAEEQRNNLDRAHQKHHREVNRLKEVRSQSVGGGADGLMRRMEADHKSLVFISKEKLPAALKAKEQRLADLKSVVSQPSMFQDDLDQLHQQITGLTGEINTMIEKRMVSNNPGDDKLALFRQQAAIIARKKEGKADELRDQENELKSAEADLADKKTTSSKTGTKALPKGEAFKAYLSKLRDKSVNYKGRKAELGDLRAEYMVLTATHDTLNKQAEDIGATVAAIEGKAGVSGYMNTREGLENVAMDANELDAHKGETLEDYSEMVKELTSSIATKKTALAPLIAELRKARGTAQSLETQYEEKKANYDKVHSSMDSSKSKVETEVQGYREEVHAHESRFHYLTIMAQIHKVQQDAVKEEQAAYVSRDGKKKQFRDIYSKKLKDQQNVGKHLIEKEKMVRTSHDDNMKLLDMWRDLSVIMKCKASVSKESANGGGGGGVEGGATMEPDRLVFD